MKMAQSDRIYCFFFSQAKDAKACLRLDNINVTVVPDKIGNPNGMQISYEIEDNIRNLFVYAETSQVTIPDCIE